MDFSRNFTEGRFSVAHVGLVGGVSIARLVDASVRRASGQFKEFQREGTGEYCELPCGQQAHPLYL